MSITYNVTLHGGTLCYKQAIELACYADSVNATVYKWTSTSGSNQSEYSANITVIATDHLVEYTCMVTDSNGNHGYSSVSVQSDGKPIKSFVVPQQTVI